MSGSSEIQTSCHMTQGMLKTEVYSNGRSSRLVQV